MKYVVRHSDKREETREFKDDAEALRFAVKTNTVHWVERADDGRRVYTWLHQP